MLKTFWFLALFAVLIPAWADNTQQLSSDQQVSNTAAPVTQSSNQTEAVTKTTANNASNTQPVIKVAENKSTDSTKPSADNSGNTDTVIIDADNKGLNSAADVLKKEDEDIVPSVPNLDESELSATSKSQNLRKPSNINSPLDKCIGLKGKDLKQCIKNVINKLLPDEQAASRKQ